MSPTWSQNGEYMCGGRPQKDGTSISRVFGATEDPTRRLSGTNWGHGHSLYSRIAGGQVPKPRCLNPKTALNNLLALRAKGCLE
jgi:hypothetical protein